MNAKSVRDALDKAFAPDVTITLDGNWKATAIETHTGCGIVWYNRIRQRFQGPLSGLSVDALTDDWPGVTFETIMPEDLQ